MDFEAFKRTLAVDAPPAGLGAALEALWWDGKGNWENAHECAQRHDDVAGMRVHAYLHRKEGDPSNAAYWYRRARVQVAATTLEAEWDRLVRDLLDQR